MLRSYLKVSDLQANGLNWLLQSAADHKAEPRRSRELLAGDSVTLYFNKPSTRTRISFETAVHRLGGLPIVVGPADLQMGRGETIEDTARVISRYSRAFVARTYADEDLERFAAAATIPVVNALTDGHHPCQALADLLTLREHFGKLAGLTVVYVGAGNNVTHSLMEACALAGVHFRCSSPEGLDPDPAVVAKAKSIAQGGATVELVREPREAVKGADCIYSDTWHSMGDPEAERAARDLKLAPYRIDTPLMKAASKDAIFLHCLPAHRGEEVTDEVADSPASKIFDQAENKLHTSIAVLDGLLNGKLAKA